jgi:CRISPR-associated endonuclease/helicase Cas3
MEHHNDSKPAAKNLGSDLAFLPWAKMKQGSLESHRLLYHLLDVSAAFWVLWHETLGDELRNRVSRWLGMSSDEAARVLCYWFSLHDLGKASPAFQDHTSLSRETRMQIRLRCKEASLSIPIRADAEQRSRHEVISTWSLIHEPEIKSAVELPTSHARAIAWMLGGHHGKWPTSTSVKPGVKSIDRGGADWTNLRLKVVRMLRDLFRPEIPDMPSGTTSQAEVENGAVITLLSGILSVSDWIGSNEQYFHFVSEPGSLADYWTSAIDKAHAALRAMDWRQPQSVPSASYASLFGFAPSALQTDVQAHIEQAVLPGLSIIEAPMGVGKTEAALASYAHWVRNTRAGLYIAMPTTATSNQMHDRVSRFLNRIFGPQAATPLLVHSQAHLRGNDGAQIGKDLGDESTLNIQSQAWFLPRKKSLLAPYGVGTVDQTLMSVLQTKHFFVRLFGLAGKVVIFDEVHAYDAYMSALFDRLLMWLRAINASVIVLSATLPAATRRRLLRAWGAADADASTAVAYPRISLVDAVGKVDAALLSAPATRELKYQHHPADIDSVIERLRELMGASQKTSVNVAVICNTVRRAQDLYARIREDDAFSSVQNEDLILFHARFPMHWREEIERRVIQKFGPNPVDKSMRNPNRPLRAIVISTQVMEQSLDLDFDAMFVDFAPVDLMLQRAGRLQRHRVNDESREAPDCLLIMTPPVESGVPQFSRGDTFVYERYVLLRSWMALSTHGGIVTLPGDLEELIEAVYGERVPDSSEMALTTALESARAAMDKKRSEAEFQALGCVILPPHDEALLTSGLKDLEEDNPEVHSAFRALTRADAPGVNVICLFRRDGNLYLDPDSSGVAYTPRGKISHSLVCDLARRGVNIKRPDVERYLLEPQGDAEQAVLAPWAEIAALKFYRVAIFENHRCELAAGQIVLRLDQEFGLRIERT